MIKLLRKFLFPFAILYGFIIGIRNFLFDKGILKSYSFEIPIIAVGNLSTGGTGKTPQIEYLIRLLSPKYKVATLSRGYKRQSKGFILADARSNAEILGDEPFQFYSKFKDIQVAVATNRKKGIEKLLSQKTKSNGIESQNSNQIILLDDAFQHRKVKAGFYILLTSYNDLYSDDLLLPTGNLRESRSGAHRANMIIVTKCPLNLSFDEQNTIKRLLLKNKVDKQELYFSYIDYDDFIFSENQKIAVSDIKNKKKLLLAGIAKPQPFFDYLKTDQDVCLTFPDHHFFTQHEISSIQKQAATDLIVTTEKDYVRLKGKLPHDQLYYLPIQSCFLNGQNNFDKTILDFVKTNSNKT